MKKLILILTVILLTSCDNSNPLTDHPPEQTTLEQQQTAEKDTVCYKIQITDNNEILLINSKTNLVEKEVSNYSGGFSTAMMFIGMIFIFFLIIVGILD